MSQISSHRKFAYYAGNVLLILGLLVFGSVLVTGVLRFGDHTDFVARGRTEGMRAIIGMSMALLGGVLRSLGERGLAGSGVVLDPKRARRDLEPYSRMAGGMVKDALDEAGVQTGGGQPVVMLRCRSCSKLNEEDSKFCQECGQPI